MTARVELQGKKFGRWTVLRYARSRRGAAMWVCKCKCGVEREIPTGNLRSGGSTSCGCFQREVTSKRATKHKQSFHPIYRCWVGMKDRCSNKSTMCFKDYGGRGIKVCDRWLADFWNFWDDMAPGWRPNLSIDRIDVNGNYEPGNCRWATQSEQMRNTRNCKIIETPLGKMTLAEAAERSGLSVTTIKYRVFSNWPKDLLLDPTRRRRWWRNVN